MKLGGIPSHLRRCLLTRFSTPSTAVIGTSWIVSSHMSLGSRSCWKSQALNFPGNPDPSMLLSHSSACFSVLETLHLSVRDASYHFPWHLIGFSSIYGIASPWTCSWNLLVTFPLLITMLLDFLGLNFIRAQVAMSSSAFRIHLACTWVEVVMVRSSITPLIGGWWVLDSIGGPLDSFHAALLY